MSTPRCLIVDDDAAIRDGVQDYLQRFGFAVDGAADGAALRRAVGAARYDIVILDLMLPGEDGLSLLPWLRERGLPVLMLTAIGDPASRVLGLESGADDYLAKPFEPRELVARLRAVLRRGQASGVARGLGFGDGWRYDRERRVLLDPAGTVLPLSSAEQRLLQAFLQRPRRVLSRDTLLQMTRAEGAEVSDRSIDLAVSRLRAKLGDDARASAPLLRTVRGEGYSLDCEVAPCAID